MARQTMISQLNIGMVVMDPRGKIISLNPSAQVLLGLPEKRLLNRMIQDFLPIDVEMAIPGKTEIRLGIGEKSRLYQLEASALTDWRRLGVGHLLMLRDVTEQKQVEAQPGERRLVRQVGSVIVAAGYDMLDPRQLREYGYGTHPDILTATEFERLVNSAGPTGGEILRPSNGEHVKSILFVLCVGSRDQRHFRHCSRFCCMYSIKHAYQAIDHGVHDVSVLYMDIRAYGKGFDSFWSRTREAGARFVRGRPSLIRANGDNIQVVYENTETATRAEEE